MTSFVVKEWQPLSVLKMLNAQAMHSRFFGGKMKNAYCTVWAEVVDFFSCSSFHTGDVASAMMWCRLRWTPPLPLAFIVLSPLYKWNI